MPKDLKDQLAQWQTTNPEKLPTTKPPSAAERRLAVVEAARVKREQDAKVEAELDDDTLFARAVDGIQGRSQAILSKFDARPLERTTDSSEHDPRDADAHGDDGSPDDKPRSDPDTTLFMDAVAGIPRQAPAKRAKKKS